MISIDYANKFSEEMKKQPPMDAYFIRVYHMKDGSKIEMDTSVYRTEEGAHERLWHFHPTHEEGADDMANVDYITIEKRFSPAPYWED